MGKLAHDHVIHALSFLETNDLIAFGHTSSRNLRLSEDNALWRQHPRIRRSTRRQREAERYRRIADKMRSGESSTDSYGRLPTGMRSSPDVDSPLCRRQFVFSPTRGFPAMLEGLCEAACRLSRCLSIRTTHACSLLEARSTDTNS